MYTLLSLSVHVMTLIFCPLHSLIAAPRVSNQMPDEGSVFISFCPVTGLRHRKFNKQLCRLAEFLQNQGYTLYFEPNSQAQIRRLGGVANWKEACIKRSKNILVVCTPEYFAEDARDSEDPAHKSTSRIAVDCHLLRQLAYGGEDSRIIPVMLDCCRPSGSCEVPMWLQPLVRHSWPSGQRDLDLCLRDQPRYVLKKPDPSQRIEIKPIVIDFPRARRRKC